jgi:beta-lactamase class A
MSVAKIISFSILLTLMNVSFIQAQLVSNQEGLPFNSYLYEEVALNKDMTLQTNLEKIISNNKTYSNLVAQKKLAIGLVDLRHPSDIKYAAINPNYMMYAASLPKIAVLLAAMESIKEGCLNYDNKLKSDLRLMIAKSNNAATTRVIERIGFEKIESILRDQKYRLYNKSKGGGLWVGKKYAKAGKKNPDPLKGLSHAATVEQVCRYYTMLAYGKLVDEEYNSEMLHYLKDPEINHKFVKSLKKIDPGCDIYRKSGSWGKFHSDSALVYGDDGRRYILVVLAESSKGSKICSQLVYDAEKALGIKSTAKKQNHGMKALSAVISK